MSLRYLDDLEAWAEVYWSDKEQKFSRSKINIFPNEYVLWASNSWNHLTFDELCEASRIYKNDLWC